MTHEEAISVIADAVWLLCRGPQWLEEDRELIRTAAEVLRPARGRAATYGGQMSGHGWIGVDLDGTLAHYEGWVGVDHIGEPVPAMVERVKAWLSEGQDVRIFTARVWPIGYVDVNGAFFCAEVEVPSTKLAARAVEVIRPWCLEHLGQCLPITCQKDYGMIELWDDRCVQVEKNTGRPIVAWACGEGR